MIFFNLLQTGPLAAYYKLPLNRVIVVIFLLHGLFMIGSVDKSYAAVPLLCCMVLVS